MNITSADELILPKKGINELLPVPPRAAVHPFSISIHGHTRHDPYYWLRYKDNPDVIAYLEAENSYTEAMMSQTRKLQQKLYEEMISRIRETDSTIPVKHGKFSYYSRTETGQPYGIFCRKLNSPGTSEEILLDLNALAGANRYSYLELGIFKISPNHQLLAYSLDTNGSEDFVLYIKDLTAGDLWPECIHQVAYSAEWTNDNQNLFYTIQDQTKRSYKLLRHRLGTDPAEDVLVYHESDELYDLSLSKTKDQAYLVLESSSMETTEIRYLDADKPESNFVLLYPRKEGIRLDLKHLNGVFYILSDENAANNKVMTVPVSTPAKENWQEYIPHRNDVLIESIDLFANYLVLCERIEGLRGIRIVHLASGKTHAVSFPETVYTYHMSDNPELDTNLLRFTYVSLTTPDSDIEYNMDTRQWVIKKQRSVLAGYDPTDYTTERIWAVVDDNTQVPISLVYRCDVVRDGCRPCLLYGFGAYGYSQEPRFSPNFLSLLDRGFTLAIAHVRGGEEMGRAWYEQGKLLNKRNTFTDFIACARCLIAKKYTCADKLAIMGRSAGGLLIGAVVTKAPHLFKVAIASVPFVDVVTTMLDETIPSTIAEFEEWGNPKDKTFYDYMLTYSPYDNVREQQYPHLLVTAGLNDPWVQYWEPAKWVAKLRTLTSNKNLVLLKTHMSAGHFDSSDRYAYLRDVAFEFAFILDVLEITH